MEESGEVNGEHIRSEIFGSNNLFLKLNECKRLSLTNISLLL